MKNIEISRIDLSDKRFSLSTTTNEAALLKRLKKSITLTGLIEPVTVYKRSTGKLVLVDGFARLNALRALNKKTVKAELFVYQEHSEKEMFIKSLINNSFTTEFSLIGKVDIIQNLVGTYNISDEEIISKYHNFVQIPPSSKYLTNLKNLFDLSDKTKQYIDINEYSLENALLFIKFTPNNQNRLIEFFTNFHITDSVLRKLLTYIFEITQRDALDLRKLLTDIKEKLEGNDINELRELIFESRFPSYSKYKNTLDELKSELALPPCINLRTPRYFEGRRFRLQIDFESQEELKDLSDKVDGIIHSKTLQKIFELY